MAFEHHRSRRNLAVADVREQLIGLLGTVFRCELQQIVAFEQSLRIQIEAARLFLKEPTSQLDAASALFTLKDVFNPARAREVTTNASQSRWAYARSA